MRRMECPGIKTSIGLCCLLSVCYAVFNGNTYVTVLTKLVNYTQLRDFWICGQADHFDKPLLGIPLSNWTDLDPYSLLNTSYQCKTETVIMEDTSFIWEMINDTIPYMNYSTGGENLGYINQSFGNWSVIKLKLNHSADPNLPGQYSNKVGLRQWADYLWGRATHNVNLCINATCNLPTSYRWLCGNGQARKQLPENWTGQCTMGLLAPPLALFNHTELHGIVRGLWGHGRTKREVNNPLVTYGTPYHSFVRALIPALGVAQLERTIVNVSGEMEAMAYCTATVLFGLQVEVDSLKKIVLQNHKALDALTAQVGGVCTLINESCCSYVEQSGKILKDVKEIWKHAKILHDVYQNDKISWLDALLTSWGLNGWLASLIKGIGMILVIVLS
uniref:Uncharacterized protein n=1 Tax=Amazona collaria TaxID=241587 RepID=A0A8B9F5X1_9PSIT